MTVTFPPGLEAAGTGAVFLAPAIANVNAPKVSEFTGSTAVDLSCHLMGFETGADQGKVTSSRYCLRQAVETLGRITYSISDITVVYDPQNPDSATYKAYTALMQGGTWALLDRRGIESRTALAAGQVVDVYEAVRIGAPKREPITDTEGEQLRTTFTVAVTGQVFYDKKMVA